MKTSTTATISKGDMLALLDELLIEGPRVAAEVGLPATWCLSAAGLTHRVLTRAGYNGVRVVGVDFAALNAVAWPLFRRQVPVSRWPHNARLVGTDGTGQIDATGWDGHAVAYVPSRLAGGQAWIVDLSAPQFSQPAHGVAIPPLRVPVSSGFFAGEPQAFELPGANLIFKRNPALTASVLAETARADEFLDHLAALTERRINGR